MSSALPNLRSIQALDTKPRAKDCGRRNSKDAFASATVSLVGERSRSLERRNTFDLRVTSETPFPKTPKAISMPHPTVLCETGKSPAHAISCFTERDTMKFDATIRN